MIRYWNLGLVAACVCSLWLIAFLSQKFNQNTLHSMGRTQSRTCQCPRNASRKCSCLCEVCKCSACLQVPGESDWFDRHFLRTIEPLQRSEDSMSSDALLLWLSLQGAKSEKKVESKQMPEAPPNHPPDPVGSSCRTCAVVGNSRSMLGSGLGFMIDQHDMVLRMNLGPVQGFETDVGNKTTMCVMYPEMTSMHDPGTQLLLLPLNSSGLEWVMKVLCRHEYAWKPRNPGYQIVQFPGGTKENKDKVLVISLSFLRYIQEYWLKNKGQYPSLGFVAIVYALHTCDQVSLFGFGADRFERWSHYWDAGYLLDGIMQKFPEEQQVIFKLQCEGKVGIYSRDGSTGGPRSPDGSIGGPKKETGSQVDLSEREWASNGLHGDHFDTE